MCLGLFLNAVLYYFIDPNIWFCASSVLFLINVSLYHNFKSRIVMHLLWSCYPGLLLAVWCLFWFHINIKVTFSSIAKNAVGLLFTVALYLYVNFESRAILTTLDPYPSSNRGHSTSRSGVPAILLLALTEACAHSFLKPRM